MKKQVLVPIIILKSRTGYNAFSPLVDGCVVSDTTIDRTIARMRSALEFHIEGLQLTKQLRVRPAEKVLRKSFEDYGTDAVYAAIKVAA